MQQVFVNAIITGSIYALIAAGFSLMYNVQRFFYIAHGAVLAVGAFTFHLISQDLNTSYFLAFPTAFGVSIVLGVSLEVFVHRPLRRHVASNLTLFIASSASLLLIQNLLLFVFGPSASTYQWSLSVLAFAGVRITYIQIMIVLSTISLFCFLLLLMKKTLLGKSLRALADSVDLSRSCGLPVSKLNLVAIGISAMLASAGGILQSFEQDLRFDMGLIAVLKGIIASIIGGIGNVPGALAGGLLLGLIENLSTWILPSGYKNVVSSLVLIGFLLFRPNGIMGSRVIK
jgi:branched-subunit amino acid ABC-type transport system permease component